MKTLQTLKMLNWHPDVIHCHDWQTALIPVYLKEMFRSDKNFAKTKSVLTIHNLAFQGIFKKEEFSKTGLRPELFMPQTFEFFDKINLLKAGIVYADKVTTVSPQYAKEILTQTYGCGLDGVLRARRDEVIGILNGIDYKNWSPKESPYIVEKFDVSNYQVAKPKNKQWLLEQFNFDLDDEHPVFGFVGRLSHQKGIDLIIESMDDLAKLDVRVIIQGVGEQKYQSHLTELSMRYSNNVAVRLEFEERIAREIYAGSDFFLMPSLFEPCGLAQMIALCHGTIPIAYKTGGLVDTIKPFKEQTREGNGFLFEHYSKADFLNAIKKAIRMYEDKKLMDALKDNAFASNYSWANSAKQYQELYTTCLLSV